MAAIALTMVGAAMSANIKVIFDCKVTWVASLPQLHHRMPYRTGLDFHNFSGFSFFSISAFQHFSISPAPGQSPQVTM